MFLNIRYRIPTIIFRTRHISVGKVTHMRLISNFWQKSSSFRHFQKESGEHTTFYSLGTEDLVPFIKLREFGGDYSTSPVTEA
jgi:hypothetical protein